MTKDILRPEHSKEAKLDAVSRLLTTGWKEAREKKSFLRNTLLELGNYASMDQFLDDVGPKTAVIAVLGGANTRWDKSFEDPQGVVIAQKYSMKKGKSRALAQVPNVLPDHIEGETTPLASYAMLGIKDLLIDSKGNKRGKHIIIYSQDQDRNELESAAINAGISQTSMRKSEASGHADAILPHIKDLEGKDYVLTYFSGDVISPESVQLGLLALHIMKKEKQGIDAILPSAKMDKPKYPIHIDVNGIPGGFGQERVFGEKSLIAPPTLTQGGSNVGIRIYSIPEFTQALMEAKKGIQGREYALDDVDQYLRKRERQLAISAEEEISHSAKTLLELPEFLANEIKVFEKGSSNSTRT